MEDELKHELYESFYVEFRHIAPYQVGPPLNLQFDVACLVLLILLYNFRHFYAK